MPDNVIDATAHFGPGRERPRTTPLDELRATRRVALPDRVLIAQRLGDLAVRAAPDRARGIAKQWFERIWHGDRWAKRRRLICFPGEVAPAPGDEGAYVASGGDWAALIVEAARTVVPHPGTTGDRERDQLIRDVLRGTQYVPGLNPVPLRAENAQSLLCALARRISDKLQEETDLCRLWDALESTPLKIESYKADRESATVLEGFVWPYEGDSYSLGPLGEVSKCAAEASQFRYRQGVHWRYRFQTAAPDEEMDWAFPLIRLGLRGHRRTGQIFVVPQNFVADLPPSPDRDEDAVEDSVVEWLAAKGLMEATDYLKLPEFPYTPERGFGWRAFSYELVQTAWLEVRRRADGSPGLWASVAWTGFPHYYPEVEDLDTLSIEARRGESGLNFIGMCAGDTGYEFVEWPTYNPIFMDGTQVPTGAFSGLVDLSFEELPSVEGWIDDLENLDLQETLFRNPENVRFCPSFAIDESVPAPCQPGTIAAAMFQNAATTDSDLLGRRLMEQAITLSSAGLRFHHALLTHHRAVIDKMLAD